MMTMYVLALRLGRWGIAGFGAIAFFLTLLQTIGFYRIAGTTEGERQAFGRSMRVLAAQFSVIIAPPMRPDTVGGYVQFRAFGALAIMFAIWALTSASGAVRGDEERGLVQAALGRGISRPRLIAARVAAFATGSMVAALAAGAAFLVGVASGGESVSSAAAVEAAIALGALAICCYSLTLFVAQLTSARSAIAFAGVILLALFLINSLSRTFDFLVPWRWLSPFHYYEQSSPLVPGGTLDVRATFILLVAGIAAAALAAQAFRLRDVGAPLIKLPTWHRPASYKMSQSVLWRLPVVRDLYDHRIGLLVWTAGVSALGAVFVVLTKSIVKPLLAIPALAPYFSAFVNGDVFSSFFAYIWFGFAQLLMAGFAIAQVARWTAEDSDGRLELILSNPISRVRVVLERAIVLTVAALIVTSASGVVVGLEAHYQSIELDRWRLAEAALLLVPFTLVFGTVGAVLASRIPRATVGLLGAFAIATYVLVQLGPIFKLPTWLEDASPFKLYGQPLSSGVDQTGLVIMLGIVVIGIGASALVMQRRDLGA
jgi:polyether ionophore transport system permease protein